MHSPSEKGVANSQVSGSVLYGEQGRSYRHNDCSTGFITQEVKWSVDLTLANSGMRTVSVAAWTSMARPIG
jgi:hypothetical protein